MKRYHATAEGQVPFTEQEEAEWDAQEAAHAAGEPRRNALAQIASIEATITARRRDEALLDLPDAREWLALRRAEIAELRTQL